MAHDIFISYSHKDKAVADAICANLEIAGVRCWIAPRDIAPGQDWPTAISNAIKSSRIMVLVFSANSNSSEDVSRELILAANNRLIIIPFKIDDITPEPGKQYYLARTHWLDAMNPPTQEQINLLIRHVNSFMKELQAEAEPAPAAPARPISVPVETKQTPSQVEQPGPIHPGGSTDLQPEKAMKSPPREQPGRSRAGGKPRRTILWAGGAVLALALLLGGAYAIRTFGSAPALPTPTQTPTPSLTPTSSIRPTGTITPTRTSTPPPAWVASFAGPILTAIADSPATFQDEFGAGSGGWQADAWCGSRIAYMDGELVITECRANRPNINYNDFVIKFDARILPGGKPTKYGFTWRAIQDTGNGYSLTIFYDYGDVEINYQTGGQNSDAKSVSFDHAAHTNNQTNTILVIGKGSQNAVYLNDVPLYYFESSYLKYGDFRFYADETTLAIDNLKIWNLADLSLP